MTFSRKSAASGKLGSMDTPASSSPSTTRTRAQVAEAARLEHARRHELARSLAEPHDGVVTRAMLLDAGLTAGQIRTELERGAWHRAGWHTSSIAAREPVGRGLWWRALWESGRHSALDGTTALLAAGLTGWTENLIHVSVPHSAAVRKVPGVQHHHPRDVGDIIEAGLRRTKPAIATIRAAQWSRSDRAASTLIAMAVQQRIVDAASVLDRWQLVLRSARRPLLHGVIGDVCNGAQSLGELDFARLCRSRGLPTPTLQAVRTGERGRVYLDVSWDDLGVHVEINGVHHYEGRQVINDALRGNDLAVREPGVIRLQIPVLGLRTSPDRFMTQVERALAVAAKRPNPDATWADHTPVAPDCRPR